VNITTHILGSITFFLQNLAFMRKCGNIL